MTAALPPTPLEEQISDIRIEIGGMKMLLQDMRTDIASMTKALQAVARRMLNDK